MYAGRRTVFLQEEMDMSQCLRCNKPCGAHSVFCNECRLLLQNQVEAPDDTDISTRTTASNVAVSARTGEREASVSGDPLERITVPYPLVQTPQTPPPSTEDERASMVEEAMQRLSDAARRIAAVEAEMKTQTPRRPHASRLAPLRDISAEIQRNSTPLPSINDEPAESQEREGSEEGDDLDEKLPDLWPWLHSGDTGEYDQWAGRTDPLMARRFPDPAESARIEEEDMRRARAAGLAVTPPPDLRRRNRRLRIAFICLAILAVIALVVDGTLVSLAFLHPHRPAATPAGPPTLTLSSSAATYGQNITISIRHFAPLTHIFLTRDIEEPIQINASHSSIIQTRLDGSAQATVAIDSSWNPGFHTINAEDITTRYTANATLQIAEGPTRPSHLILSATTLDLGAAAEGANTIQPFTLHNSGNAAIVWTASSDQPWLVLTPTQGIFSDSQTILVGAQRANLKPGDYQGTLTFSSNVGASQSVTVTMTVRALPANVGAALAVTPAVLSFTSLDGGADPNAQTLVVSNPGSQPLHWELLNNTTASTDQGTFLGSLGANTNWLSTDQTSGVVDPGSTDAIQVMVHSQNLLPGTYINTLTFSSDPGVFNSPQSVSVSLTVQAHCSLELSTGSMSFTAIAGQSNPSNQALSVGATASCPGTTAWHATSSANWLTITPASGQLQGVTTSTMTVGVNLNGLAPRTYTGNITVQTAQGTQTVIVQLTVQAPPPPTAPIIGASPLNVSFTTTQGQANPPGQAVTITNTGGSPLMWRTAVNLLASSWLGASPTGGTIEAGQTGQVTININASSLTPGTYVGQVVLAGTDSNNNTAGGSPQTITINLVVLPPCTLAQPSSSALSFSAMQGGSSPNAQSVSLMATGNCNWPLGWKAHVTSAAPWLNLSPASGSLTTAGQSATINVTPDIAGLAPGTYTTQVSVSAIDSSNLQAQGSPQVFSVELAVQQPCSLHVSPAHLSFSLTQGQSSPTAQSVNVSETGACARPVSWSATASNGSGWLALSGGSGSNNGSVGVSVNLAGLAPGNYTGTLTIAASGNGSAIVQSSPQTVSVSLAIAGFSISGTVNACADSTCSTPKALPGATLSLLSSTGSQVMSVVADASGNYAFNNVPLGSYTISASGTDSANVHYTGTGSLTVTGNQQNVTINAIASSS